MFRIVSAVILALAFSAAASAQDIFTGLTCKSDIHKALQGKKLPDANVATLEKRHKELALDDYGAQQVNDRIGTITWAICGTRYTMIVTTKTSLILDIIATPPASARNPMFSGTCEQNHVKSDAAFIGILDNSRGYNIAANAQSEVLLPAIAAWKIDEQKQRFVQVPAEKLACSVQGVYTRDGGA